MMHSPLACHSNNKKLQSEGSPLRSCEEILAFEEAFDTFSLRKFFQEHESTNSQSAFSPLKENSIPDDIPILSLDDPDFLFLSSTESNFKLSTETPLYEAQINSNASPRAYEPYQVSSPQTPKARSSSVFESSPKFVRDASTTKQTKNIQIIINGGNIAFLNQDEKAATEAQPSSFIGDSSFIGQYGPLTIPEEFNYDYKEDQSSPFKPLLRSKKIFKIERTAPRPVPLKSKKQANSSKISRGSPITLNIKSNKSYPNITQENDGSNVFFPFRTISYPAVTYAQNSMDCLQTLDENNNFVNYIIPPLRYNGQILSTGKIFNISNH